MANKKLTNQPNGSMTAEQLTSYVMQTLSGAILGKDDDEKASIRTTVEFSKETSKIIIPEGMTKKAAAQDLINQWENEEQTQKFQTILSGWEWKDGLRAVRNVIEEKFGWVKGGLPSFFGPAPTEISIITGYKDGKPVMEQAFYGPVTFPAWEDANGEVGVNRAGEVYITLSAKRKFSPAVNTFFQELNVYLQNNSIYRGKAVVVTKNQQEYIDLEITEIKSNDKIVLNEKERMVIDHFVLDQLGEQGKRCFLFTGDYGNGKSETAMEVALHATSRGISFLYLKDAQLFERVLGFAKKYEPCVVFVEDIDEIASGEERNAAMNKILNTLDGVQTKGRNITVLFTTNHERRINKALRRPGRIDLIINFSNPTQSTAKKIIDKYISGFKGYKSVDWDLITPMLPNVQAAVLAEVGKRAERLAQRHDNEINTDRVMAALTSMEFQIDFMKQDTEAADPVRKSFDTIRDYIQGETNFKS